MTKKEVLEQLKEGKITSEEAMRRLDELDNIANDEVALVESPRQIKNRKPRWIIVKVRDDDGDKVDIKVPLAIVKLTKKLNINGSKELDGIDFDSLMQFVEENGSGKFVDIKSKNGEIVEIYVE